MIKNQCLIVAGEKSGEEHSMSFFAELRKQSPNTHFFGVGGEYLTENGVEILYDLKDFSSMGFTEVFGKLKFYFKALDLLENEVLARNCKTAILIDFQGFNLKLCQRLHKQGVKVLYYVAPQAWSWKEWRVKYLAESAHTLFTLLPFEKKWFMDRGVKNVKAILHPVCLRFKNELEHLPSRKWPGKEKIKILVLPGSRNAEVKMHLPIYIKAIEEVRKNNVEVEAILVKTDSVKSENYLAFEKHFDQVLGADNIVTGLTECDLCIATSGTVTMTCGLFAIPTVVSYKITLVNYLIAKCFVRYKGPISITNIVHQDYVFPELLMYDVTAINIASKILKLLSDEDAFDNLVNRLRKTKEMLRGDDFSVPNYMSEVINGI